MLEIGIWKGESLRMWAEWLPNADIYAIDVQPGTLINAGRIRSFLCDQADGQQLAALAGVMGPLDFVVDDGSHVPDHQIASANALMPFLRRGGVYVIEDVRQGAAEYVQAGIRFPSRLVEFNDPKVTTLDDRVIVMEAQ